MATSDISDPLQARILELLAQRSMTGLEISEAIGAAPASTYARLNKLLAGGVVKKKREGNKVYYSLTSKVVEYLSKSEYPSSIHAEAPLRGGERTKLSSTLAKVPIYTLIAAGAISLAYASYYALQRGTFLSIVGGLIIASVFWAFAAWLSSKMSS